MRYYLFLLLLFIPLQVNSQLTNGLICFHTSGPVGYGVDRSSACSDAGGSLAFSRCDPFGIQTHCDSISFCNVVGGPNLPTSSDGICPLICPEGQVDENGQCVNDNPCLDQIGDEVAVSVTMSNPINESCISGCTAVINQSRCFGDASSSDPIENGFCFASFTGGQCSSGSSSSSSGSSSSSSSSGGDTGDTGDTGDGDSSSSSSSSTSTSSTSSSTSSSSTSSSSGGSDSGGSDSGSSTGDSEDGENISATPATSCAVQPSCSGDPIQCALLEQQHNLSCASVDTVEDCNSPFVCNSDPVSCAQLKLQRDTYCAPLQGLPDGADSDSLLNFKEGVDDGSNYLGGEDVDGSVIDLSRLLDELEETIFSFDSACFSDIQLDFFGSSHTIPLSYLCEIFALVGVFILLAGYWHSLQIIFEAF